jgi:enoyl-CoA hydratase/carnithine racemase
VPGAGGTQRLTRLAGRATASRVILTGETLDGTGAAALGLAHWAVPRSELPARAADIAARIAASPGEALAACKSCIAAAQDPARDGFAEELSQSRRLYASEATRELVGAFLSGAPH